ncbi:hypothetical protein [Microbacterium pygmaeum]|uniref:Uncharacterized protein n=1 Tax=Microbacterium pygmaeum TaxID=370764 RepID=A0A1G7VIN2_9MICO|nr:hypothetical protein [Microbacterium pygmaeum]SDG59676.1 hypothetical protein SAMN04489810_0729 [Microbacterium pygmaeum]
MSAHRTERVEVVAEDASYLTAIAELPLSARRSRHVEGAVAVLSGDPGWVEAAQRAAIDGAVAVVIAAPAAAPSLQLRRLVDAATIPMIVQRPLLRPDVVQTAVTARAGAEPRLLTVDGAAPGAHKAVAVRDALGWLRSLSGERLTSRAGGDGLALLETRGGLAATLSVATADRSARSWLRVQVLGEVVTEVEVEEGRTQVTTLSSAGRLTAPTLFESAERLTLRRALRALSESSSPPDLADLLADCELADSLGA